MRSRRCCANNCLWLLQARPIRVASRQNQAVYQSLVGTSGLFRAPTAMAVAAGDCGFLSEGVGEGVGLINSHQRHFLHKKCLWL